MYELQIVKDLWIANCKPWFVNHKLWFVIQSWNANNCFVKLICNLILQYRHRFCETGFDVKDNLELQFVNWYRNADNRHRFCGTGSNVDGCRLWMVGRGGEESNQPQPVLLETKQAHATRDRCVYNLTNTNTITDVKTNTNTDNSDHTSDQGPITQPGLTVSNK